MKSLSVLLTAWCLLLSSSGVFAEETPARIGHRLTIIDPYADVHSGPGRGYPVFYAIEQGETVNILARRPDWYEIRLRNGKTGWVSAAQISRTIQETGEPADLPSVSFGDYLKNSFQVGFSFGKFGGEEKEGSDQWSLQGSDFWSVNAGYRVVSWLGAEVEYGRSYREEYFSNLYGVNVMVEPLSKWRLSPYLLLGAGSLTHKNQPKETVVEVSGDYSSWGLGGNYYLGRNFIIRAEYRSYLVTSEAEDVTSGVWKIGFNSFF